jgi:hypothetical protein
MLDALARRIEPVVVDQICHDPDEDTPLDRPWPTTVARRRGVPARQPLARMAAGAIC